jgi:hypothetical protein
MIRAVMQPRGTGLTVSRARSLGVVVCLCLTGTATAIAQSSGTFVQTGSMAVARAQHSATLLVDDRVLIGGGTSSDSSILASVEIPANDGGYKVIVLLRVLRDLRGYVRLRGLDGCRQAAQNFPFRTSARDLSGRNSRTTMSSSVKRVGTRGLFTASTRQFAISAGAAGCGMTASV